LFFVQIEHGEHVDSSFARGDDVGVDSDFVVEQIGAVDEISVFVDDDQLSFVKMAKHVQQETVFEMRNDVYDKLHISRIRFAVAYHRFKLQFRVDYVV
jgi:hypothetical protein